MDPMKFGEGTLSFGDPIPCSYPWLPPRDLDEYANDLGVVANTIDVAIETLPDEPVASICIDVPPPSPVLETAGLTPGECGGGLVPTPVGPPTTTPWREPGTQSGEGYSAMLERSMTMRDSFTQTVTNMRGVRTAMHNYADGLRVYRDALRNLKDEALRRGLEADVRIFPPVIMPPEAGTPAARRWEQDWKAYADLFEDMRVIREQRREAIRALKQDLYTYAGVRPPEREEDDHPELEHKGGGIYKAGSGGGGHGHHGGGDSEHAQARREAAEAAWRAIQSQDAADAARRAAKDAAEDAQAAERLLDRLRAEGADRATIAAQKELVGETRAAADAARAHHDATQAKAERDLDNAQREAREFNQTQKEQNRR